MLVSSFATRPPSCHPRPAARHIVTAAEGWAPVPRLHLRDHAATRSNKKPTPALGAADDGKCGLVTQVEPARPARDGLVAAGPAYRSSMYTSFVPPQHTLYDNFVRAVARFADQPCLGRRIGTAYHYMTFAEAGRLAEEVASAMVHLGMRPHDRASVFGANSPEWMVTMQACNQQTIYCVPLYDVLGDSTVDYIIAHSESSAVFVAANKLPVLAKAMPRVADLLKFVVYWGGPGDPAALEAILRLGVDVFEFREFAALGREHPAPPVPPRGDDICTIMYTSGTSGTPKGVPLTHRALTTEVSSLNYWFDNVGIDYKSNGEVYLSFLPLAHIYGRCMEETFMSRGIALAYWSGDAKLLPADIKACQPTVFCSVPRVFERFESAVMDKVNKEGGWKRLLFDWAFQRKLQALKAGAPWDKASPIFDKLVFKAISKQMLGDRIQVITSGGAPLASHLEDFMRVAGCAMFLQGYGLTETCAATFVSRPDCADHIRTVGHAGPAITVRLEAVPEMDYDPLGDPPRGEILVKGDPVFTGYYKNEEETRKALDSEGWFHTGDVGEFSSGGALRVIDRKKNIFKLSQGEYIAVEKIEDALQESELVEQIWIYGSRYESCLVAVVVPNKYKLETWAREHDIDGSFSELCGRDDVKRMVVRELDSTGKREGLKSFELPKAVYLETESFSVNNELLTPTFELRRTQLLKKFSHIVDGLYRGLKAKPAAR